MMLVLDQENMTHEDILGSKVGSSTTADYNARMLELKKDKTIVLSNHESIDLSKHFQWEANSVDPDQTLRFLQLLICVYIPF